jgi:glycerol-3-phosphate cytidylyltransferase
MTSKLFSLSKAQKKIASLKTKNKTIVFTNGCFDIMHAGHISYLQAAKMLGDYLIIGLNSDKSVQKLKGPLRPIVSEQERLIILSALEMIDMIILFDDLTPIPLLQALQPHIQVKGGDYQPTDMPEYPIVKEYGGQIIILPFKPGCSTSNIINKIISLYPNSKK